MILRGCFDCRKARPHYVLMNLESESNWKQYKEVVEHANVVCLEVHGLGERQSDFGLAITNDDFPNDTFEREEANIDDDDISLGSEDGNFEEDGVEDVEEEEESKSKSDGPEYEDEESESEEDGPQVNTTTVHDVEDIGRMGKCFCYSHKELRLLKECHVELPSVPNDKDISMVHKAICESTMGMKFNRLEELKFFLADYTVRLHRPFSVVHCDKKLRYDVMCKQGCMWRVWSWLIKSTDQWRISKPKRVHVQCTTKYLGRRILGIVHADSETLVPSLVESIFALSGYRKESYGKFPRVLIAMAYYNPGVKWFTHSSDMMQSDNGVLKHVLQRVFWCFPQCRVSFQHCHLVILVDGTFLIGKYKGTLMMAVVVDPEHQLVPLAFALAESENNDSWSWFMKIVRRHILGLSRQVCMISVGHHGLLNCVNDHMEGFPPLVHRWCMRHFAANMWHRQKNKEVIGKLKVLCMVHTEKEFDEKLQDLVKNWNDEAKEWLKVELEDKDKWAQAFDEGGMLRPVSRIIEYLFDRWQKACDLLNEGHRNGKVADEHISDAELRSVNQLLEPYEPERMVYSIRGSSTTNVGGESHGGRHYRVDLNECLCSCNIPQLLHLPCSHLIITCKARGYNYESPIYMSPLYFREHTIKIESSFELYLDLAQWPSYDGLEYVPNSNLKRNKIGRRQKKRLRGDMDESQGRLSADYGTGDFNMDKMADLVYPVLEAAYDMHHCGHLLADHHEDLKPLRPRVHSPLRWDERYVPYLHRAGFLDIALVVAEGLPPMDGPLLTAMVDRWRPKTHTFHLRA
uniref:SWIM-type domain-containing protein n=1 Tax=Setaria italica TaxID=4555 RepID=K4AIL3_SETIT